MLADRSEILRALRELVAAAAADGLHTTIAVLGGAAIELHLPGRGATRDIDALVYHDPINQHVASIAALHGWPDDWLNDAAKAFVSDHDDPHDWPPLIELGQVVIRLAPIDVLIAMKLKAARGRRDLADLDLLLDEMGWTPLDALEAFDRLFPHDELSARAVEFLAGRSNQP